MGIRRTITRGGYKGIAKPILFRFSPDKVHAYMLKAAFGVSRVPFLLRSAKRWFNYVPSGALSQNLAGLYFENPVGIAAGLDKNAFLPPIADMIGCGYTTVGSVTMEPREGNSKPWFYRLPKTQSIVVHAGMANEGLKRISQRLLKRPATIPTFVSIAVVAQNPGATDEEIIADVQKAINYIIDRDLGDAIEINISCPNVHDDEPFSDPQRLHKLLRVVDKINLEIPVFIKMPNRKDWKNFEPIIDTILRHKIQGVTISNLVKDRKSVKLQDELPDSVKGALSGKPTRQRSLILIKKTRAKVGDKLVIIGLGGIFTPKDAYETLEAGADLIEVATGLIFEGPQLVNDINAGLEKIMLDKNQRSVSEIHQKSS